MIITTYLDSIECAKYLYTQIHHLTKKDLKDLK